MTRDDIVSMVQEVIITDSNRNPLDFRLTTLEQIEHFVSLVAERDTALLRQALEALESVYPYTDSLICYASTVDEHPPNAIDGNVRDALTALRERLGEKT